jgi:hypothetical protein
MTNRLEFLVPGEKISAGRETSGSERGFIPLLASECR